MKNFGVIRRNTEASQIWKLKYSATHHNFLLVGWIYHNEPETLLDLSKQKVLSCSTKQGSSAPLYSWLKKGLRRDEI